MVDESANSVGSADSVGSDLLPGAWEEVSASASASASDGEQAPHVVETIAPSLPLPQRIADDPVLVDLLHAWYHAGYCAGLVAARGDGMMYSVVH
ncbi:uncharacterized protein AMSG_06730 [Thecamonas trahens ATCC 50062]|uniref:Survival motor neuron Tudor domain-containing protein n=1 Tax=Thecamonas trahens ATCC 50062 TaxID=461836 RepID=A0A0L0DER6_THETB|nr:hypothetical protein AMSG_06730 [Thecamonas trahens ATCC 50062]KNC50827.1 hypothetical protein AMSG_06730 [Thecamonas trahens ATCC 50062]|eukprot:XP_013756782.1 hypothetical protein AMSG_06730 [Thecamonas trahens ATCC 50062]